MVLLNLDHPVDLWVSVDHSLNTLLRQHLRFTDKQTEVYQRETILSKSQWPSPESEIGFLISKLKFLNLISKYNNFHEK